MEREKPVVRDVLPPKAIRQPIRTFHRYKTKKGRTYYAPTEGGASVWRLPAGAEIIPLKGHTMNPVLQNLNHRLDSLNPVRQNLNHQFDIS